MGRRILSAPLLLITGCIYTNIERLPLYDWATRVQPGERVKLFYEELVDWQSLPCLVPFAVIDQTYDDWTKRESLALRSWWRAVDERADVVSLSSPRKEPSGLIHASAVLYRLAPCEAGFRLDSGGTVTRIDPRSNAKQAGLLEGDRPIAIGGSNFEWGGDWKSPGRSQFFRRLSELRPGDEYLLVWIRPGAGRMEGRIRSLPNEPTHLCVADSIAWQAPITTP